MDPREESLLRAFHSYNNNEYPSIRATTRALTSSLNRPFAHALTEQQTEVLPAPTNSDCSRNKIPFLLTGSSNKRPKGSLPLLLVHVRKPLGSSSSTETFSYGKKWNPRFINSHLCIRSLVGRPIEAARINGTYTDLIQDFYQSYEEIVRQYDI
jgi:hypothetical protein